MTAPLSPSMFPIGNDQRSIRLVYGDPSKHIKPGCDINELSWRAQILTREPVKFPSVVRLSNSTTWASRVMPHRLIAPNLAAILAELAERDLWRHVTDYAGCYAYRPKRGGSTLSLHSWAVALDFNAERYPLGTKPDPRDPFVRDVVPVFQAHGWTWGGEWSRPDVMHLQATQGA